MVIARYATFVDPDEVGKIFLREVIRSVGINDVSVSELVVFIIIQPRLWIVVVLFVFLIRNFQGGSKLGGYLGDRDMAEKLVGKRHNNG